MTTPVSIAGEDIVSGLVTPEWSQISVVYWCDRLLENCPPTGIPVKTPYWSIRVTDFKKQRACSAVGLTLPQAVQALKVNLHLERDIIHYGFKKVVETTRSRDGSYRPMFTF